MVCARTLSAACKLVATVYVHYVYCALMVCALIYVTCQSTPSIRVSLGQHFVCLLTLIDGSLAVIHLPNMVGWFEGLNCV